MATETNMTLADRIQALPPELYNKILDLTTLPDIDEVIKVDASYRPPIGLSINRTIRAEVARLHYSKTAFDVTQHGRFEAPPSSSFGKLLVTKWLKSMPVEHRAMINQLRWGYVRKYSDGSDQECMRNKYWLLLDLKIRLRDEGVDLPEDVFYTNVVKNLPRGGWVTWKNAAGIREMTKKRYVE